LLRNDSDHDSVVDSEDNCKFIFNPAQIDSDGDGLGNACQDQYEVITVPRAGCSQFGGVAQGLSNLLLVLTVCLASIRTIRLRNSKKTKA
jgi:hypothetical protein